ncbi:MAG: DUF1801 domain-containing protein [Pirellulales bacterium]
MKWRNPNRLRRRKPPRRNPRTPIGAATLGRVRTLIQKAVPGVVEERKWIKPTNPAGVPVWSLPADGKVNILCTGETYKTYVKLTFAQGAKLPDPAGLFNAGLEGNVRRAIDLREDDALDAAAFTALVKAAAAK